MTGGRLRNRVAIVTGAAGGIGSAIVRRLLLEGAHVCAVDIDVAGAERAAATTDAGGRLFVVAADVASEQSCADLASAVDRAHGRVDIVVNNAAIFPPQQFEDISYADWRRVIAVNLDGAFLVAKYTVPLMKRNGWGRLINIGSGTFWLGTPGFAHYAASKGGLIGLTRVLAYELGEFGITVNTVSPGITNTEVVLNNVSPELIETRRGQRALGRHQFADDVVGAITFLVTEDADFITGQTINVDGGLVMH